MWIARTGILASSGSYTGLLDTYSGAITAYSLRKLRASYTGSAITVRRSSDNTSQDFGFNPDGTLDTVSLLTFVGSGDGYITRWQDQSGNNNDYFQTTLSLQPKIVSSGSLITDGGKPSILFSTSGFNLTTRTITQNINYFNTFGVAKSTSNNNLNQRLYLHTVTTTSGTRLSTYKNTSNQWTIGARRLDADAVATLSTTTDDNARKLITSIVDYTNTDAFLRINGTQVAQNTSFLTTGSTSNTISTYGTFGFHPLNANEYFVGYAQELITYMSSVNTTGIESNINTHYNIY
jgi:hypothetical protein